MWRNEWKVYDHHTMTRHTRKFRAKIIGLQCMLMMDKKKGVKKMTSIIRRNAKKNMCVWSCWSINDLPQCCYMYIVHTYIVRRSHWFHWKAYILVRFTIIQWVLDYWNDNVQKKFPDNQGIPLNDNLFRFSALRFMFWPITSKILFNEKKRNFEMN